jgi:hypothetical protein
MVARYDLLSNIMTIFFTLSAPLYTTALSASWVSLISLKFYLLLTNLLTRVIAVGYKQVLSHG